MEIPENASFALKEFKTLGATISIDNFGTGYSSLSYLKRFSFDRLKIDKSFVRDMMENLDDRAIVTGIIALTHSLKALVTAEGVDTEQQAEYLRGLKCDEMQGLLFGKPASAEDIVKFLAIKD